MLVKYNKIQALVGSEKAFIMKRESYGKARFIENKRTAAALGKMKEKKVRFFKL